MVQRAESIVRETIGDRVFGSGDESLEGVIVRMLTERGKTLAVAESCTGGYVANRITNVPGASAVLLGSEGAAEAIGTAPLARVAGKAAFALDPHEFGYAPVEAANRALALARSIQQRPLTLRALDELAAAEEARGNATRALAHLRTYQALRDSVFNRQTAQRIAGMELEAEAARQRALADELRKSSAAQRTVIVRQRAVVVLAGDALGLAERDAARRQRPLQYGEARRVEAPAERRRRLVEGEGRVAGQARLHGVLLGGAQLEKRDARPAERLPGGRRHRGHGLVGVEGAEEMRGRRPRPLDQPEASLAVRSRGRARLDGGMRGRIALRECIQHVRADAGRQSRRGNPGDQRGETEKDQAHRSPAGTPVPVSDQASRRSPRPIMSSVGSFRAEYWPWRR